MLEMFVQIYDAKGKYIKKYINPLSPELNPICYLLALLAHVFSTLAG
jgi:transposase